MNYIGPDPLEMWFKFICWYEQNSQYDTQGLFETALGKCLSTYECDERYNQDNRMVKLWMKYVSIENYKKQSNSNMIFDVIGTNSI